MRSRFMFLKRIASFKAKPKTPQNKHMRKMRRLQMNKIGSSMQSSRTNQFFKHPIGTTYTPS